MHELYFYQLPHNVARSAFRDVVEKFVQDYSENPDAPKPIICLEIPDRPTADYKHSGHGYIEFQEEKAMEGFLAKACSFIGALYASIDAGKAQTRAHNVRIQKSRILQGKIGRSGNL